MNNAATNTVTVECPNCSGAGHIERFGHIADGVCFTCKGAGQITVTVDALNKDEKLQRAMAVTEYNRLQKESLYILCDEQGDMYSNDLCELADACEARRAAIHPSWGIENRSEMVYIVHRADGRRVTRGEVARARSGR